MESRSLVKEMLEEGTWQGDLLYSVALLTVAVSILGVLLANYGFMSGGNSWLTALFFLVFGVYTIAMGFPHPGYGHVSFDRAGQVAAILILGPVDAAWICGLASLVFPWKRLLNGVPLRQVVIASMHNAGLMVIVVLTGGFAYTALGGPVPLTDLSVSTAGLLLVLILTMQAVNDLGMLVLFKLCGRDPRDLLTIFTTAVELWSALIAVLVALVFASFETGIVSLLLVVLTMGMLVLKRYAEMRWRLEALVEERTEELREKSLELERQATHDKLTGLHNRRYADDFLERQIEQSKRNHRGFSIALGDIDHFKQINDRYSHATGDAVLVRVAETLRNRCRQTDVVARYGGEEFLLCFPDTDGSNAERICGELRRAIAELEWSGTGNEACEPLSGMTITMSFGVAAAGSDPHLNRLLDEADVRLYRAKNDGRNRVVA